MHHTIALPHVPLLLINSGFADRLLMSGFCFYLFTFARSLPNVASTIYSFPYLTGELDWKGRWMGRWRRLGGCLAGGRWSVGGGLGQAAVLAAAAAGVPTAVAVTCGDNGGLVTLSDALFSI